MSGEIKIYGDYDETFTLRDAAIAVRLFLDNVKVKWSQCSALSDCLTTYFVSQGNAATLRDYHGIMDAIAYIMNELVENAFKFSNQGVIDASIGMQENDIAFLVRNVIQDSACAEFQQVLDEIVRGDPSLILIERIERNASDSKSREPGLGLLSIMTDYNARLGWRFEPEPSKENRVIVSTMARLPLQ